MAGQRDPGLSSPELFHPSVVEFGLVGVGGVFLSQCLSAHCVCSFAVFADAWVTW